MKILYLSYERGLELEKDHQLMYVDIHDLGEKKEETVQKIIAFKPDMVIEREFNDGMAIYTDLISTLKERLTTQPKYAVWLIDTHVGEERHKAYAKQFDVVFLAVSKFVEPFKAHLGHQNVFWLPLCYPLHTDSIRDNFSPIKYPISFVGRWNASWFPERTAYIEKLMQKYHSMFTAITDYDNMMTIVRQSKVEFNCAIRGDMNFRVFETIGAGTELVTNDVEDLHKIKGLTEKINIYHSDDELYEMINGILRNDPKYTHNTKEGQNYIKQYHTLYKRHQAMLDMIQYKQQLEF